MPASLRGGLLADAQGIVQQENSVQPEPPATAAQTVQDDAPQGPAKPEPEKVSTPESTIAGTTDTGTNPPVRTTEETQATYYENNGTSSSAVISVGTTTDDDAANNTTVTKQTAVNASNNTTIKVTAQPNVLDDYYSYTYSAALYLLKPEQYTRLINSKTKKIDGYNLLIQSGGAATNVGGIRPPPSAGAATESNYGSFGEAPTGPTTGPSPDAGRSPFFPNDFYFDSITIENS